MKHCGELISRELERKKVMRKDLALYLKVTPQYISKLLVKSSIDAEQLEQMCRYLSIDPADFFDYRPDVVTGDPADDSLSVARNEIRNLERLLAEKDARIATLERAFEVLAMVTRAMDGKEIVSSAETIDE